MRQKQKQTQMPDEIKTPTGLPNPFDGLVMGPDFRLNVDVMTDDILVIQSVAPSRGTKQHLIASYVQSLAAELRAKGITSYSPDNLERFKQIVERRNKWTDVVGHTTAGNAGTQPSRNVPGGKGGVRKGTKNA